MSYDFTGSSYSIAESEKHIVYLRAQALAFTTQANALQQFVDACKATVLPNSESISLNDGHVSGEAPRAPYEIKKGDVRVFKANIWVIIDKIGGRCGTSLNEVENEAKSRGVKSKAKDYRQAIIAAITSLKHEGKIESMGPGRYRAVRPRRKKGA